jgi:serine/threonine protein kinase
MRGGGGGEGRPPKPPAGGGVRKGGRVGAGGGEEGEGRRKVGDEYEVDQSVILGEGSYAAVYGAVHRGTGERVAVKAIKRRYLFSEDEKASVRNEIDNMRRIPKHRNVIRLRETFETLEHVYLVMERSTHGNLDQMLQLRRKLTELETMWVVKQLLDAVDLLHRAGVLHCDLKPHNLLFSDLDDGIALAMTKGKKEKEKEQQESQPRRMWMYTSPLGMILKVRSGVWEFSSFPPSPPRSVLWLCVRFLLP